MGRLATAFFNIGDEEVSFARRGFPGADEPARQHLEGVARSFAAGYAAALAEDELDALAARLDAVASERRGFAYEGAAMALVLRDVFRPWRRQLPAFLLGPAATHSYLAHVGIGWAMARLPLDPERLRRRLEPRLGWLVFDGYGFHQGFFHWRRTIEGGEVPAKLRGYARRAFDQGVGRSLWFVAGANPARIAAGIGAFAPARANDLWSGIGLACAYAGGVSASTVESLRDACGEYLPAVAQGASFAALARVTAHNVAPWTELACRVLCGSTATDAAALATAVGDGLDAADAMPVNDPSVPKYELWRCKLQQRLAIQGVQPWSQPAAFSNVMA